MLIAFEGIDASGKNTQSSMLFRHFSNLNIYDVHKFDFPRYESPTGEVIADYLQGGWKVQETSRSDSPIPFLEEKVFQCCHLANKMECLPDGAWAKDQRKAFIADRYNASSIAYGKALGLDESWLIKLQRNLPKADLNIFLDITVEESFKRRPDRRDEYEKNATFLNQVRDSYIEIFKGKGDDYIIIDCMQKSVEDIFLEVCAHVDKIVLANTKRAKKSSWSDKVI